MKKENAFKIRSYGRTELALLYFPHHCPDAAYRKLKSWLLLNPTLRPIAHSRQRTYTPLQVEEIVNQLGEP